MIPHAWLALLFLAGCDDAPKADDTAVPTDDLDADGYTAAEGDCDDFDAQRNPGEAEIWYDGVDQDCDAADDDDQDGDGYAVGADCDDTVPTINPDATEVCDGLDNDCSGTPDDDADDAVTMWVDADADGFGAGAEEQVCGEPAGYADNADDCDDQQPAANPDAEEVCDEIDNDCDGVVNEDAPNDVPYYRDADADGFGDAAQGVFACSAPDGYVSDASDCDDLDAAVNPGMEELCDDVDRDCDGDATLDATDGAPFYADADADGYGDATAIAYACAQPEGYGPDATDCDDADSATYPGAVEVCDLEDNDCDADIDEGAVDERIYHADADSDGYGGSASSVSACGLPSGYAETDDDCDDANGTIHPDASETCSGIDEDCDGEVDEDAVDATTWYADADADTYGDAATGTAACDAPRASVADATDCDDARSDAHPGGTELCDLADNDCDGTVDEGDAADAATWYEDGDLDGYGTAAASTTACDAPTGYAAASTDCDDAEPAVNPAATEACNGIDDDCDTDADEAGATGEATWYLDADIDGYGTDVSTSACDLPVGYCDNADDCDDGASGSNPGAAEADDLADNDCDGFVDEDFVVSGDVFVSEVARQSYVGGTVTNANGQWIEIHNGSARTVDLSNWYVVRTSSVATDAFYVDPADGLLIAPGGYAVLCKTDDYTSASTSNSTLLCDYLWGDASQVATYAGTYHDNTFNLQRDEDTVTLYSGGDASTGTAVDSVHWSYSSTSGYWPRDATRSMSLDPAALDGTSNDSIASWCSTTNTSSWRWFNSSGYDDYGSPGAANYDCP